MFQGSIVALITPFRNGQVDEKALRELLRWHAAQGTSAVVPVGTTGESPTLSEEEARRVIEISVEEARAFAGKMKVIAGTGSNATAKSVKTTQWAASKGADAALIVCPYYNRPTQEGVYQHYKAIAEDGGLPVVVYTIPARSGINIEPSTIVRLAELKNIVAVKEASGNLSQMEEIMNLVGGHLDLLSGDDALTLPMFAIGAKGVISVVANLFPDKIAALCNAGLASNFAEARRLHEELYPLFKAIFAESNPIGIKAAMKLLGKDSGELRLPLTPLSPEPLKRLEAVLRMMGDLK